MIITLLKVQNLRWKEDRKGGNPGETRGDPQDLQETGVANGAVLQGVGEAHE